MRRAACARSSPRGARRRGLEFGGRGCRTIYRRHVVLGSEHVDGSLAKADDLSWPLQQPATEYCRDEIWNRPDLDRRSRSILHLGMISAPNRPTRTPVPHPRRHYHLLSKDELRKIFLQVAVYCGMPAAIESFRLAREVFEEIRLE